MTAPRLFWVLAGPGLYFIVFYDVLAIGKDTLIRGFDASVQSFAWMGQMTRSWGALEVPLWDFNSFSGTSFIGELQTGVLYPLNILITWFPATDLQQSLDWYLYLHYVLAFWFMALFLRHNGFGVPAAALGSFAFASYLDWAQPHRMAGMIFLPLILFFFQKSLNQPGRLRANHWMYLCGMALSLSFLAGHNQPYLHSVVALLFLGAVLVVQTPSLWPRVLRHTIAAGVVSIFVSAPQLLLSLEHYSISYRWGPNRLDGLQRVPYETYGFVDVISPELLSYLLLSWILPAALLAVVVLITNRTDLRVAAGFGLSLGVFAFLISLGDSGLVTKMSWHIPLLNSIREAQRWIFLILSSGAVLMAVDVEWIRRRARPWLYGTAVTVAAAALWVHSQTFLRTQSGEDALTPRQHYQQTRLIRELTARLDADGRMYRYFNFNQCLPRNLGNVAGIPSIQGHRATIQKNYFDYVVSALANPHDRRLDQLGVRYVVSCSPLEGLALLAQEEENFLYERPEALPVFRLRPPQSSDFMTVSLLQITWRTNRVTLRLAEPVRGMLVFAQPSYPGWTVECDGESRTLAAEGVFMGVELQGTEREITFAYRPWLLTIGLLAAALPFFALGACFVQSASTRFATSPPKSRKAS